MGAQELADATPRAFDDQSGLMADLLAALTFELAAQLRERESAHGERGSLERMGCLAPRLARSTADERAERHQLAGVKLQELVAQLRVTQDLMLEMQDIEHLRRLGGCVLPGHR